MTTKTTSTSSSSEATQLDKFKEAARELECDDDEKRFKERLGKLAKSTQGEPKRGTPGE